MGDSRKAADVVVAGVGWLAGRFQWRDYVKQLDHDRSTVLTALLQAGHALPVALAVLKGIDG